MQNLSLGNRAQVARPWVAEMPAKLFPSRLRTMPARMALCVLLLSIMAGAAVADMHRVILDGVFGDWDGMDPIWVDPTGDGGSSGIDLGAIWASEDEERLYLRFEVGRDLVLQDDNQLTLYIDTDNNPATGFPLGVMGAELVWVFGSLNGFFFYDGGWIDITWPAVGLIAGPTHSGWEFEVCIARDAVPDGVHPLFTSSIIQILFRDQEGAGDWAPDLGEAIDYTFDQGTLPPLEVIYLERDAGPVRLLTYNVLHDQIFDYWPQQAFRRILQALEPDVIAFQEIYAHSATETRLLIEDILGGSWDANKVGDKVLLTRSTILDYWSIADDRAGAFLISPQGDLQADVLVINVHLSCCDNDPARQEQCDAIMAFVRDAKTVGGQLDLGPENPIIITGDTNFVGLVRQLETLLTGDILDNATHGPDFPPDWDDTDLSDLISRHVTRPMGYTWYKEWSEWWPGRLDYIIYTDSNLSMTRNAVLQTNFLSQSYLDEYGLRSDDTDVASDHLPHFADLVAASQGVAELPVGHANVLRLRLGGPNPAHGRIRLVLELPEGMPDRDIGRVRVSVHDAAGRLVRALELPQVESCRQYAEYGTLTAPVGGGRQARQQLTLSWDGANRDGRPVSAGAYWARLTANGSSAGTRILLIR